MSASSWAFSALFFGLWALLEFWRHHAKAKLHQWYQNYCPSGQAEWLLFHFFEFYEQHWFDMRTYECRLSGAFSCGAIVLLCWLLFKTRFNL